MHKVVFAAALAVGLITAPMSQFVSSAAAQQANAEKNAKTKKEPSAGQLATRERQKKCGAEWKEAKASNKIEKGTTWPKFWSACNNVSSPPPTDIASTRARRSVCIKRLRASARLKSRRRPQGHPNRGVPGNRIALITP
jgi:hypothetical protein